MNFGRFLLFKTGFQNYLCGQQQSKFLTLLALPTKYTTTIPSFIWYWGWSPGLLNPILNQKTIVIRLKSHHFLVDGGGLRVYFELPLRSLAGFGVKQNYQFCIEISEKF